MNRSKLLKGIGSATGSRLAIAASNYGLFWSISHMLDKEQLGGFSVAMSVFFLVQLMPLLGLAIPHIRRVATEPEHLEREVANAFAFALPVSLALALLVGLGGQAIYGAELALPFWLVAISLIPTSWTLVAESTLVGRERIVDIARINLLESVLRTALALLAIRIGWGLGGVFVVFLAMRIVIAGVYLWHPGLPVPRRAQVSAAMQRRNWNEVPVYFGIAVIAALLTRLDVLVVSSVNGLADAAVYSAAARLYEAALMLPNAMALVIMPALARQFTSGSTHFRESLLLVVRGSLILGAAVALAAAPFASDLVSLLYRPSIGEAGPVLRWLAFAAALMTTDVILSSIMLAAQAQKHDLRALAASLGALILMLAAVVRPYGAEGAAAAVVVSLLLRVAMRVRWLVGHFDVRPLWIDLMRIWGAAAAGATLMVIMQPRGAWASSATGVAAFALCYFASGGLGRSPLRHLRELRAELAGLGQK